MADTGDRGRFEDEGTRGGEDGPPPADRLGEILAGLADLLDAVNANRGAGSGPTLASVVGRHLGVPADSLAVTREEIPLHRFTDADIALDDVVSRDPAAEIVGVGGGEMRYHHGFGDLVSPGRFGPPLPVGQVDRQNESVGPDEERAIVSFGVRLFRYRDVPMAVLQRRASPRYGQDMGALEVLCPDEAAVADLLAEVRRLSNERSIVRSKVVTLADTEFGPRNAGMAFVERPQVAREDVILPEGVLDRIEGHVAGIAAHGEQLRAAGQHLKRGVLLYGPPGTGKTHTVRYLLSATPGHTVVLLSGGTLKYVGLAAQIARALQPAIVVLEDCDLVAEERGMHPGAKPLLFEVLDAMDGLAADSDVTFLLTTNRVDALERALAQRPGRVDLAVEIPLPDEEGRARLLRLYAPPGAFSADAVAEVAARTQGTTASFTKELVRRAVLAATLAGEAVGDAHLRQATTSLLSDQEALSRRLLGGGSAIPEPGWHGDRRPSERRSPG